MFSSHQDNNHKSIPLEGNALCKPPHMSAVNDSTLLLYLFNMIAVLITHSTDLGLTG